MGDTNPRPSAFQAGNVKKSASVFATFKNEKTPSPQKPNGKYANLYTSPVPAQREIVRNVHVGFCDCQRKFNAYNGLKITKTVFMKNILALIQRADKHAAIIGYKDEIKINSLCHPNHVPHDNDEFEKYFPRTYNGKGNMVIKCRFTTSIPLIDIKKKIRSELVEYNYFLWPTMLRATRTGKLGWLFLAHPDFTQRHEIAQILQPLIKTHFGTERELQAVPETETITVANKKIQQRVLMLRCAYDDVDDLREFLTTVFSPTSTYNIGYSARYTFIPTQPVADCTIEDLQSILDQQQIFHQNVQWFVLFGVQHINVAQKLLNNDSEDAVPTQEEPESQPDVEMTDPSGKRKSPDSTEDQPAPVHQEMSLRYYLYNLETSNGEPIFHSIYATSDDNKTYILCSKSRKRDALAILHNIEANISAVFEPPAIETYISRKDGKNPYIPGYPIINQSFKTYASTLKTISSANPQEHSQSETPSPAKQTNNTMITKLISPCRGFITTPVARRVGIYIPLCWAQKNA